MDYSTGFGGTYFLVLIGAAVCLLASASMRSTFSRYARVQSRMGITGREAAERILRMAGIYDVSIQHTAGNLTDHYDPGNKVLRLSDSCYNSRSVAALGVAAHECGHAIQHQTQYLPLKIRGTLVPVANLGSTLAWPLIMIGLLFSSRSAAFFINLGILAFSAAVLFQIVTLPVEFNASRRALKALKDSGLLYEEEVAGSRKVLRAAALTYVAGAAAAILQLLRLILMSNRRHD